MYLILPFLRKVQMRHLLKSSRVVSASRKYSSIKSQSITEEEDKPIPYLESPASKWKAEYSRTGTDNDRLWYEPYVVLISLTIFMVYFCVLREENDIDKEFDKTFYGRFIELEENELVTSLEYNRKHGLPTKDIEDRLRQIQKQKVKSNQ